MSDTECPKFRPWVPPVRVGGQAVTTSEWKFRTVTITPLVSCPLLDTEHEGEILVPAKPITFTPKLEAIEE